MVKGNTDYEITGLAYDSRQVKEGYLFVCICGYRQDGHKFIPQALASGAGVVVAEREEAADKYPEITRIIVPDSRLALAYLGAAFYQHPSRKLKLIGITGTNGKTTISYFVASILRAAGYKVGVIGTIHYQIGEMDLPAQRTTPESLDLQRMMCRMLETGIEYGVLEVSSHSLELGRVVGSRFSVGVFSNLGRDHLDFHQDTERYFAAKQKLFEMLDKEATAVINLDDPYGAKLISITRSGVLGYGLESEAMVSAEDYDCTINGTKAHLLCPSGRFPIKSGLPGEHNLYNILAAAGVAVSQGISPRFIQEGISNVEKVPGRFEPIECGQDFKVIVDYAHTPDALQSLLVTVRKLSSGRIITLFGCGGERDRGKRPIMGKITAELSDYTVITSDNPRQEDPLEIIREIEAGITDISQNSAHYLICPDRYRAIWEALASAQPGDTVILAGKGHEDYQLLGNQTVPFDDRRIAREMLKLQFGVQKNSSVR